MDFDGSRILTYTTSALKIAWTYKSTDDLQEAHLQALSLEA
jgi:hypothetical protein